jgi:hypothetical protein
MKGFPELGSDHFFSTSQSRGQTTFSHQTFLVW